MTRHILLSIKEIYLRKIEKGEKTVEFRKVIPSELYDNTVFYLVCKNAVHGYFHHNGIDCDLPMNWSYSDNWGISQENLLKYCTNDKGHITLVNGIYIKEYIKFETPIPLKEFGVNRSPQNFCYTTKSPDDIFGIKSRLTLDTFKSILQPLNEDNIARNSRSLGLLNTCFSLVERKYLYEAMTMNKINEICGFITGFMENVEFYLDDKKIVTIFAIPAVNDNTLLPTQSNMLMDHIDFAIKPV